MSDNEEQVEDYTIYPLKADPLKVKYPPVGKHLLTPPFTLGIISSRHTGKCFGVNTPIKQFDLSIKKVQDIKVGDKLLGDDNKERIVESICEGEEEMYIVKQECGITYRVNKSHILSLINDKNEKIDINIEEYLKSDLYLYGYKIEGSFIVKYNIKILVDKVDKYYGFEISGNNRRFKLEDDTIVHNTVLAQNLFCRPYPFYGGCFDRIILISGTLRADRSARHMVSFIGDENCFEDYDDRIITGLIDQQKNVEPEDQEKILIIADDIPSLGASQTCALYRLATTARHHNISVCYISQLLRSTGKGGGLGLSARNNIEGYFIGRQSNRKVLDSITEELSHFQSPEAMLRCYNDIVSGNPYSFMFCNSRNLSIMDNLKEEVFRRYDENGNYNADYSGKKTISEDFEN